MHQLWQFTCIIRKQKQVQVISHKAHRIQAMRHHIYSHSHEYGGTHQKCIAQAKTVLQNNSFGDFEEGQYLEIRTSETKEYHDVESLSVVIECNQITELLIVEMRKVFTMLR